MVSWTITVSGERVPANFGHIREELDGDEEAVFTLPNNPHFRALTASDNDVVFKFGGETIYEGLLTKAVYDDDKIKCIAHNKVYTAMDKKVITNTYHSSDSDGILADIAAEAPGVVAGLCPASNVSVRYDRANCLDAARHLAQSLNTNHWTTGGSSFNIGVRGSDKGTIPVLSLPRRTQDRGKKRDKVLIRGFDASGVSIYASAGDGSDIASFTERKASDVVTLKKLAQYKLNQLNKDTQGVKLTAHIMNAYDITPGDTITVNKAKLKLSGSYTIWKTTKYPTTVNIEIDKAEAVLEKLFEKTKGYEDFGIYSIGPFLASGEIPDGSITTPKIAPSAVTGPKIQADAIEAYHIAASEVQSPHIAATQIQTFHLSGELITTEKLTSDQIYGKDFRTSQNVGEGGGPAGIRLISEGIEAYSSGTTKTFWVSSADGKAYCAGGTVILDDVGITVHDGQYLLFRYGGTARGGFYPANTRLHMTSPVITQIHGDDGLELSAGGNRVRVLSNMVPNSDNDRILGSGSMRWKEVHSVHFYGSPHYADVYMSDLYCKRCGDRFKSGDKISFTVKRVINNEIECVPVHSYDCERWWQKLRWW